MAYMIDPPEGWRYGFPKEVPKGFFDLTLEEKNQWFLDNGYPKERLEDMAYCRVFFLGEDDD